MKERRITFRSGELVLEGKRSLPAGAGPFPAVVVCHPHPSFGGSMDNNVVLAICEKLFAMSMMTLRFNFRGVGESEGHFSHGAGEQEDVAAALSYLAAHKKTDPLRIGFAGYSAGAVFGLPAAVKDTRVRAMAAVSLPLGMMELQALKTSPKPKLFVLGSRDDYTSEDELNRFCRSCAKPTECGVIKGADHFWQGHEADLAAKVGEFLQRALGRVA